MKTNIESLVGDYKQLEKMAHVSIDDVINKVTQEVGEVLEAYIEGDKLEMYGEAGDVLVNVLSVAQKLGIDIENIENNGNSEAIEPLNLALLNSRWNDKVQSLRSRYSRKDVSIEDVSEISHDLITEVLKYSDPEKNILDIVEKNLKKFTGRTGEYLQDIDLNDYISDAPDFPKQGINFKDIGPLLKSPEAFRFVCMEMINQCRDADVITGLDSRGFLFGPIVAQELGKPFVMIRKKGKLPGKTISQDYGLEYGSDVIELQEGAIKKGQKVALIDDLLATGGTINAVINLVEKSGGIVNNISLVISLDEPELSEMENRKNLEQYRVESMVSYD